MTPADIARNAAAVRNLAARLERLGFTGDSHTEAEHIAANLLADGYREVEKPPALAGPTSTEEGRRRAREIFEETRRAKEAAKCPATCTRCGDTSAAGCEDWDCHKGWTA